ncbi:MAG TPA: tail fiber protein [Thermoanaerobaculia bacterium]|nr:tail fiber protein [Thermoanaerobaculia bacterium]
MDPFLAEIRIFPFYFAPKAWAHCDGQLIPLSQNTALFALLGTYYGGDGKSTFALPDLQDRAAMHPSDDFFRFPLGSMGGSEYITLLESEIPAHTHSLSASNDGSATNTASGNVVSRPFGRGNNLFDPNTTAVVTMAPESLAPAGGDQPHNNMQPFLTFNFCIALQGVFPPRP